jgi:hypothetical protein
MMISAVKQLDHSLPTLHIDYHSTPTNNPVTRLDVPFSLGAVQYVSKLKLIATPVRQQ